MLHCYLKGYKQGFVSQRLVNFFVCKIPGATVFCFSPGRVMCYLLNCVKMFHVGTQDHIYAGYRGCQNLLHSISPVQHDPLYIHPLPWNTMNLLPQLSSVIIVNAYFSPIGNVYFAIQSHRLLSCFHSMMT